MLKTLLRRILKQQGLSLFRSNDIPFGFDWCRDVASLTRTEIHTCFDVGANTGQTAERLVTAFPAASVHSFEPVPATFEQLRANCAGLPQVSSYKSGFSEKPGSYQMEIADECGRNRVAANAGELSIEVQLDTIDHFCHSHSISDISLLKIDVEGHELQVLKGADQLLREGRVAFILCECDFFERPNEPHGKFDELSGHLNRLNYRLVSFYTGGVDKDGWVWGDALFAHTETIRLKGVSCSPARPLPGKS